MTLEDAVLIVGTRARAVENISSDDYAMAVVAADRDECESVLARQPGWAQVSVINSPRLVGISGDHATVQATVDRWMGSGGSPGSSRFAIRHTPAWSIVSRRDRSRGARAGAQSALPRQRHRLHRIDSG